MSFWTSVAKAIGAPFYGFGALGAPPPTSNAKPNGGDGIVAYGGYLPSPESSPLLIGDQKWITYANATNTGIVATGLRRTLDMLAGTEWHAKENEAGGKDAKRGVEIVTKGLLNARLPKPWATVVRKAALYRYYGFSMHEWSAARSDSADQVVFTDISHRPQYTIDRWDKPDEKMPWIAVSQLTRAGNRFVIPRARLFHAVDDSLTDSPDGVGLLRHIVELVRRLGVLEGLEGLAYQSDLRGMPVGGAPIGELAAQAIADGHNTRAQIEAFIATRTQVLRNQLAQYAKTPERLQYLLQESAPFLSADQNTFSQLKKWTFELLKGNSNGVADVAHAIGRLQLEIARVLGIEFALVGGNDSAGSHGMHSDKTRWFAQNLQTILTEVATFATNDLARVLIGLNGLDPDTATPTLVAEPISIQAVLETCQSLSELAKASLMPDDPAIPVIRARLHLPDPPEPTPEMLGMLRMGRPLPGAAPLAPGDPVAAPGSPAPAPTKPGAQTPVANLGPKPTSKSPGLPGVRLR